jgi:hypothetical protein
MTTIDASPPKHKPRKARKRRPKARKAAVVLDELFHWRHDSPLELEQRVHNLRRLALKRVFSDREWTELDRMRDQMRANAKFKQAAQVDCCE